MILKKLLSAAMALAVAIPASAYAYPNITETVYTPEAEAMKDISMLSLNSSAMLVKGAVRYIDVENTSEIPKLVEAKTYLPICAVRTLFNTYIDSSDDKPYTDLRYDELRLVLNGTDAEVNGATQKNSYIIYIDGKAYMPLRAISEILGKTIHYDNGYITIGSKTDVNNFVECDYYNTGKVRLDSFVPQDTGRTIYVSTTGRKYGKGTLSNPTTLEMASQNAESGDTVILMEGIYRQILTPNNDGTAGKPITYKAQKGADVVISALEPVEGFSYYDEDNGVVSRGFKSIGAGRDLLFYNGRSLTEARFPNVNRSDYTAADVSEWFPTKGALTLEDGDPSYRVTSSLLNGDRADRWKGARFVSLHGYAWNTGTGIVSSSADGSFEIDPDTVSKKWWYAQLPDRPVNFGYLTGTKEAIDLPGEWTVENDTIYMKLPYGETADSLKVEMKSRQLCIDLTGKKYINISGIKTIGGGVNMNNTEMCVLRDCTFKNISHYTLCNDSREGYIDSEIKTDSDPADRNGAPQRGEMGIYMSGRNDVVTNCTIDTSAAAGLYMTGLYSMIDNNKIINCGYMGSTVGGIYIGTCLWDSYNTPRGGYIITNNDVRNSSRSALTVQTTEYAYVYKGLQPVFIQCEIAYNRFSNGGLASTDTGVVYLWGATMGAVENMTRIHHNVIYADCNNVVPYSGMTYFDNYVNTVQLYKNVFYHTSDVKSKRFVVIQRVASFPTSYAVVYDWDKNPYPDTFYNPLGSNVGFSGIDTLSDIMDSEYPDGLYFHSGLR